MPLFWLALAVAIVAVVASAIYSTLKGLEAFRGVKRLGGEVTSELERIERATGEIERHLTLAAESGSGWRPSSSSAALARAAERAHGAIDEVRASSRRVTAVYPAQVRVAAVDLGTNSTRLLVADANGTLDEVVRRLAITRLGEGVDERRRLLPVPIARVRNVLSAYRRELESLGAERTLCIATSAVRDAENGEAFLGEIEWSYGFTTRLLSGDEEAELTLRGIGALEPGTLVVDIGGGSTEVQIVGDGRAREPRRRLRAADRALPARTSRDPGARARPRCRLADREPPSASPGRSRRSPRSTSASSSTTRADPRPCDLARGGGESRPPGSRR